MKEKLSKIAPSCNIALGFFVYNEQPSNAYDIMSFSKCGVLRWLITNVNKTINKLNIISEI